MGLAGKSLLPIWVGLANSFDLNKVRVREKTLEELRKALKDGALGQVVGTVAELRPQVAIAQLKADKLKEQLAAFQVHDSYKELSRRAAQAKTEMQSIARHNISLEEKSRTSCSGASVGAVAATFGHPAAV